jgi:SH3-like domain-containing protein
MDHISRKMPGWADYRVELNGTFLDWKKIWEANATEGWVKKILTEPEYDAIGWLKREPLCQKVWGKVFIVRYYEEA